MIPTSFPYQKELDLLSLNPLSHTKLYNFKVIMSIGDIHVPILFLEQPELGQSSAYQHPLLR